MALRKTITGDRGQITQYHRILSVTASYETGKECVDINIASYTDESYRTKEKETTATMILSNSGVRLPYIDENLSRENIYNRLKAEVDVFFDAENC